MPRNRSVWQIFAAKAAPTWIAARPFLQRSIKETADLLYKSRSAITYSVNLTFCETLTGWLSAYSTCTSLIGNYSRPGLPWADENRAYRKIDKKKFLTNFKNLILILKEKTQETSYDFNQRSLIAKPRPSDHDEMAL